MQQSLIAITADLEAAQSQLLEGYCTDSLYAFRVTTRRIRSILKRIGSHRSRSFRKTWGGFAAMTNEARDWDVFLITARKLLNEEEVALFEDSNRRTVRAAQQAVLDMIGSRHWEAHLQSWRQSIGQADKHARTKSLQFAALEQALVKARAALQYAQSTDENRAWHKFRITVKEVRYLADALADEAQENQYLAEVQASCRELQTQLGNWHDTVVQLSLLKELPETPLHGKLSSLVLDRKAHFLAGARDLLAGHPLFATENGTPQ